MYSLYDAWPGDYNFSRGTLVVVLFVVLAFTEYWILLAIICNIAHRACHGLTVVSARGISWRRHHITFSFLEKKCERIRIGGKFEHINIYEELRGRFIHY